MNPPLKCVAARLRVCLLALNEIDEALFLPPYCIRLCLYRALTRVPYNKDRDPYINFGRDPSLTKSILRLLSLCLQVQLIAPWQNA
jgi:hypothetical protein